MDITIGRTVHYILNEAEEGQNGDTIYGWPAGAQAHIGNNAEAGQVYPAVSVRVWSPGMANLQVFLDGNDVYWATSRHEGTDPGTWAWPARV